ncbi:MAG TPA: DUF3696 domain-containing protein [Candidatus Angelobacter sp.]|nr:DUF3696 domain-containing protein [Candidatus Angelobacter sp.]
MAGYKSIVDEQRIEIRPLTILAGANSSGKSSIIQPLLLLKQTLEAAYDPGALLLNGPNVKFTSASQLIPKIGHSNVTDQFRVGMRAGAKSSIELSFTRERNKGFSIERMKFEGPDGEMFVLDPNMSHDQLMSTLPIGISLLYDSFNQHLKVYWRVIRNRCFLQPSLTIASVSTQGELSNAKEDLQEPRMGVGPAPAPFDSKIRKIIHVPGIRGNPERSYPVTAVGSDFPGLFQNYAASVIAHWQSTGMTHKLRGLEHDLKSLGLTWKLSAKSIQDTEVELRVGRFSHQEGEPDDMVNIADVGLAMSQVLPVVVALRTASPGQLIFIEQPELHLHPSAQVQLAGILANAAKSGIQVVVETHSSLLLLGIQTLIAEDKLNPKDVKLHWFTRDDQGATRVTSANIDERGAFGDWPEDFGNISLEAEHRYLTASEKKLQ